jgi:hypothetical protein
MSALSETLTFNAGAQHLRIGTEYLTELQITWSEEGDKTGCAEACYLFVHPEAL